MNYTLDECAIVEGETPIYPYFINSVAGDPDLTGLTIFLQSMNGEMISRKVQYVLPKKQGEDAFQTGTDTGGLPAGSNDTGYTGAGYGDSAYDVPADSAPAADDPPESSSGGGVSGGGTDQFAPETDAGNSRGDGLTAPNASSPADSSFEADGTGPADVPASETDTFRSGFADSAYPAEAPDLPDTTPVDTAGSSSAGGSGADTVSAAGPSGTAPSAAGNYGDSWGEDASFDLPSSLRAERSGSSTIKKSILRLQETEDLIIQVDHMEGDLPPFLLPDKLEIGQYKLVFQVLGDRGVLNRTDKYIYFLGDAFFSLNDIKVYLPGVSEGSSVVTPGTNVMLEARVLADKRLDPYVVWYNGKKRIGEGGVVRAEGQGLSAQGTSRMFWKAPAQTGFHALRVEVLPFRPRASSGGIGRIKEMSLPVSSKHEGRGYFPGEGKPFVRWYQFRGDLRDTKTPGETDLVPQGDAVVQWLPHGGIYGLSVRYGDLYGIPGVPFELPEGSQGIGRILFRIAPLSAGVVFSGSFPLGESSFDTLELVLRYTGDGLTLIYTAGTEIRYQTIAVERRRAEDFITPVINFRIEPDRFLAGLSLSEADTAINDQGIPLMAPISGKGNFSIGNAKIEARSETQKATAPEPEETVLSTGTETLSLTDPDTDPEARMDTLSIGEDTSVLSADGGTSVSAPKTGAADTGAEILQAFLSAGENAPLSGQSSYPFLILDELAIAFSVEEYVYEEPPEDEVEAEVVIAEEAAPADQSADASAKGVEAEPVTEPAAPVGAAASGRTAAGKAAREEAETAAEPSEPEQKGPGQEEKPAPAESRQPKAAASGESPEGNDLSGISERLPESVSLRPAEAESPSPAVQP